MKITSVGAIRIAIDFSTPVLVSWVYVAVSVSVSFAKLSCNVHRSIFDWLFQHCVWVWFTQRVYYCGAGFVMEMRSCQHRLVGKRLKCLHPLIRL